MADSLKIVNKLYHSKGSNDCNKIWHSDKSDTDCLVPMTCIMPAHAAHLLFYLIKLQKIIFFFKLQTTNSKQRSQLLHL